MRVAFHAGQLLQPVPGGIGRYEHAMLRHLPDVDVDVVAFAAGARPSGIPARVPWIDLGGPQGSARYELWHRARRPLVRIDADIVHAPSAAIPPVKDVPLVATVHDVAFVRVPHATTRRGISFHTRGLELARRHASVVITPSAFTRAELEREGFDPARVEVVQFGIDPPAARDAVDIDAAVAQAGVASPYVLTVGTIEPRKQLPTLVRIVDELRRTHPNVRLVVCGPRGWGRVEGLDAPFVQMLGRQPWRVVDALYRRAAAFCCASLYEGFGLPALEAMARGAPTVVTTGSSMEEFVSGAGLLFDPGDVDAAVAALDRVLRDEELRHELRHNGQARAAELSWDRTAEEHARVYARVLGQWRS